MSDLPDRPRVNLAREPDFALGGVAVQPSSRTIVFDGVPETVEPRVMQVLVTLARRRGEVVSRDELSHQCWDGRVVGEDAINRCLAKVRRLCERMRDVRARDRPPRGVSARRRARWNCREQSAEALQPAPPVWCDGCRLAPHPVGAVGFGVVQRAGRTSPPRYAVLPFTSLNSGEEMHLFGKSIGVATAAALDRAGLQLVSTAPFPATAQNNPADVGRALGAAYVVSGSVRQEGRVVRAFARVDQVDGRITIYSRVFETPAAEMNTLPNLVAEGMAGALAPGSAP